jgi:hypothetical protein
MLIVVGAALVAAPTLADPPAVTHDGYLVLKAGQTALIHLDSDGKIVFDQGWLAQTDPGRPADAEPDHLLFSFTTGGPGNFLTVKNGYDKVFGYHARLRHGAASKPTSVCPIVSHGAAFETWQGPIDAIEVGDFAVASSSELRCQ